MLTEQEHLDKPHEAESCFSIPVPKSFPERIVQLSPPEPTEGGEKEIFPIPQPPLPDPSEDEPPQDPAEGEQGKTELQLEDSSEEEVPRDSPETEAQLDIDTGAPPDMQEDDLPQLLRIKPKSRGESDETKDDIRIDITEEVDEPIEESVPEKPSKVAGLIG